MSTITGLTAEKMQEIADASVVSGNVNGSGHLILTTSGGDTIDAGNVQGAAGSAGATGATGPSGASASLDTIAGANPTAADWSNNGHKVTNVGNGSADTDVAALGQVMKKVGGTFTGAYVGAVVALTFATSILVDASLGNDFRITLTASTGTLANPTNASDGQEMLVWVKQDATGSRTMAYGTNYKFTTAIPSPTLSTAANAVDLLKFVYNASLGKWVFIAFLPAVG